MNNFIDTRKTNRLEQRRARTAFNAALRHGKLIRPEICETCGAQPEPVNNGKGGIKTMIDGHHHHGYDDPLDVIWLCQTCHQLAHARRHGIAHSTDVKKRIAATLKLAYANGRREKLNLSGKANHFYGKHHTDETKKRISEARKRR